MAQRTHTIHLAQTATARGWAKSIGTSAKDAQAINVLFETATNPAIGSKSVFVTKRPGSSTSSQGSPEIAVLGSFASNHAYFRFQRSSPFTFSDSSGNSLGTLTAAINRVVQPAACNALVDTIKISAFVTSDGAGWFLYSDAVGSFTGNRTSGSPILGGIADTTGLYRGQAISGTGIPAGTRIDSVDNDNQITMTANATSGSATATAVTVEKLAKILDSNFPTGAKAMVFLGSRFFVGTENGRIYQSEDNDPSVWPEGEYLSADYEGDDLYFIFKIGNFISSAGEKGFNQYFAIDENPTGSVLSVRQELNETQFTMMSAPTFHNRVGYFIGGTSNSSASSRGLYRIVGPGSVERISDDVWSGILADIDADQVDVAHVGNKVLLLCHNRALTTFPAYDLDTQMFTSFSQPAALTSCYGNVFTLAGNTAVSTWAVNNTHTDAGSSFTATIQTETIDFGKTSGFTSIHCVELIADTEASGTATLYMSVDDGATWDQKGTFDMTAAKKIIWACGGGFGGIAFRLQHSANTGFRGQTLKVTYS